MSRTTRHTVTLAALAMSMTLGATYAHAQHYDFDESCAPTTTHDSSKGAPDALVILDRSGSMDQFGGYDSGGNWRSKLYIAKQAVTELTNAIYKPGTCSATDKSGCDDVLMGVGWFSISAGVDVAPADDTASAIQTAVNNYPYKCQTQHGAAAKAIYNSAELAASDRVGIGLIVTDGQPYQDGSWGSTKATIEETLYYLCKARSRPTPTLTFMVGFGTGTDVKMNNIFAAAGGTGQCCVDSGGVACTYQPSELVDPCALPDKGNQRLDIDPLAALGGKLHCDGSIQANTGQALKDGLLDILNEISCTFPLDVPSDYLRFPGADEDPAATRVEFDHAILGSNIRVQPYDPTNPDAFYNYLVTQRGISSTVADAYRGEGWTFGDPFRRTVTLTPKLCQEVQSNNVNLTETQVACLCENTGSDCNVLCTDANSDGYDDVNGSACDTDSTGDLVQVGRCQPGIVECIIGVEYCAPKYSMQPDVCNGVDDDCDGNIDNSSRANPAYSSSMPEDTPAREAFEWNGNQSQLDAFGFDTALFCDYQDFSCSCGTNPSHEFGPTPTPAHPDPDHEWKNLLQSTSDQRGLCACNSALELEASVQQAQLDDAAQPDDSSQAAGCQTAQRSAPSLPASALLFLSALFFLSRRRKQGQKERS